MVKLVTDGKIAETSSKGNQEKWKDQGYWYKLDQFGYEGLAEAVTSLLLERSNIERDTPFSFVRYQLTQLNVHGHHRIGCCSADFLKPEQSIITLNHLLRQQLGSLKNALNRLSSDKKRIAFLSEQTAEFTGLKEFPQYLTLLFEIDGLILNGDRHLNNIAVLSQNGKYDYCPIFDNGAGLLSDTISLGMDIAPSTLTHQVLAYPFNTTFNRQVITAESLYGRQLKMPRFTASEIEEILAPLLQYYAERDRSIISDRVCTTILTRQRTRQ